MRGILLAVGFAALLVRMPAGAHDVLPEASVKAAYVYNFGKFVEWPGPPAAGAFEICLLGRGDGFLEAVTALAGKPLQGRPVAIRRLDGGQGAAGCRILVVGASEGRQVRALLARLEGQPVLTVSDVRGFAAAGGMIGLTLAAGDRIAFEINARAARQAGLRLHATLLELGQPVAEPLRP